MNATATARTPVRFSNLSPALQLRHKQACAAMMEEGARYGRTLGVIDWRESEACRAAALAKFHAITAGGAA